MENFLVSCALEGQSHQRRIQDRCIKNIFGFVFVIFDGITRTYFNCSQYAMYKVCILFSTRTTKTCERVKGHQNNPLTQRFLQRRDRVPRF